MRDEEEADGMDPTYKGTNHTQASKIMRIITELNNNTDMLARSFGNRHILGKEETIMKKTKPQIQQRYQHAHSLSPLGSVRSSSPVTI